ncbi:MAG: right-handed parallel beta-helix repeat-containing protein, partial [Ruminococcus flavefaciens]|nr:right-handed parallel beta-helix repeat-containing protein [Ruminococcus flavefaciens]
MIVQAVEAGIVSRIPVLGINAVVFGVLHIVEGAVLWYLILVKKCRQAYYFDVADVGALAVLAVFVAVVAVRQFGVRLDDFNFELSDSARHLMYARSVADYGQMTSLYFSSLNCGLIMNMLRGSISTFSYYRIFILFETGVLFLNGAIFWVLIRRYLKDKASLIIGIIVSVAYMLGYPWNSMVFGTAYLSTSIFCVAMILFLLELYFYNVFQSKLVMAALLVISCYALLCSYSLFVPPVLGGMVLVVLFKYVKEHSVPTRKVYMVGSVLLAGCLLVGGVFLYFWLGKGVLDRQLDLLSWWGYIYGALYADFLFVIPFCIVWFVKSVKSKTVNVECIMLAVLLAYIFVLFLGNCFGKISAYYYYKTYDILWLVAFMVMLKTIIALRGERDFIFSYIVTWGVLFLVYISSAETKLAHDYNLDLTDPSDGKAASDYFSLYHFNIVRGHADTISKPAKELYMEAAKLSMQSNAFIPYIGEYAESEWTYFALAGTGHQDVLSGKNYGAAIEELKRYPYVLSVECEEPTVDISSFLGMLPVVYENEAGKIYKVEDIPIDYKSDDINVGIMLRYGLPKLERMGWVEQDEYVNSLQVIRKIEELGLDKNEFLYPELEMEKAEEQVRHLTDGHYQNRKEIVFTGTTSQELQQMINDNPGGLIDIHSNQIQMNEAIVLRDNTAIHGNGVTLVGNDLQYGFIGDGLSDLYLNGLCIEGSINYGIYLIDCNDVSISECEINGLLQKAVCVIGDTKKVSICGNEFCGNSAGGIHIAGNVSECLIGDNDITGNGGASEWMSGIVMTGIEPGSRQNIWGGFDEEYHLTQRESIYDQIDCPHGLIVRNNQISDNGALGIYSDGAYKGYLVGNTINQNAGGGIRIGYGTMGFYMEGNYLESNGASVYPGIALDNTAYNVVRNNIITNHCVGIDMVQAAVRNLIMENVVQGGENEVWHPYGIVAGTGTAEDENLDDGASYENVICRNSIMGNHNSGIFIDEGCYVNDVFDNMIMEV